MKRNIHIVHASRGRYKQALNTYNNWISKLDIKNGDSYTFAIESDQSDYFVFPHIITNSKTAIEAFNICCLVINDRFKSSDIIIALSDDFPIPCDLELIRINCDSDKLLKTFDTIQTWIVTLPIMGVEYYRYRGYIYPSQYLHMYSDTHITHEADIDDKLIIRNDIIIPHHHYSIGKSDKDELNDRNDKTYQQGFYEYIKWIKSINNKMPKSVEAKSHINNIINCLI